MTTSTAAGPRLLGSRQPRMYSSPLLQGIEERFQPTPMPACGSCPLSLWFATQQALKCYCTRMHALVWETGSESIQPVMDCDGRELAIAALLEKEAGS